MSIHEVDSCTIPSKGPGANPSARVSWSHQLTEEEAVDCTLDSILGGWKPVPVARWDVE